MEPAGGRPVREHCRMGLFRRSRATLAEGWEDIVEGAVAHWAHLDDDERERMADLLEGIVTTKRWRRRTGSS